MNAIAQKVDDRRNMTPFDEVDLEISELYDEAKNWADGEPIKSQEQHDAVEAVYKALHDAGKKADGLRVEEKKPLDDQIKVIQDRYNPMIQPKKGKVDLGKSALNQLLTVWRNEQARIKQEAADRARREAEEERIKAEEAMRSSAGDLEARERAEEQLSLAKDAEKFAKKADRAATTGLGLRTTYVPKITDLNAAVRHYWSTHRTEFEALVQDLAAKDVRAGKREIPGFTIEAMKGAI